MTTMTKARRYLFALRRARFAAPLGRATTNTVNSEECLLVGEMGRTREEGGSVVGGVGRDERVEGVLEGRLHSPHTKDAVADVALRCVL